MPSINCPHYKECHQTEARAAELHMLLGRAIFALQSIAGQHPDFAPEDPISFAQQFLKAHDYILIARNVQPEAP